MNYNKIKKRTYDIPSFRASICLTIWFLFIIVAGSIYGVLSEGTFPVLIIVIMIIIICLLMTINFSIWFLTSKSIVFSKECIMINDYRFDWHNVRFIYNDDSLIITLRRNTLCIMYYDTKNNCYKETFMRCKYIDYNTVMSIRN